MARRDPDPHGAPVPPLRPPEAGGPPSAGPVIVSITDVGGRRVSPIRRGDGSTFTVTVPEGGIDAHEVGRGRAVPWISRRDGVSRVPLAALDRLAARVGVRLVGGHSSRRPPG